MQQVSVLIAYDTRVPLLRADMSRKTHAAQRVYGSDREMEPNNI